MTQFTIKRERTLCNRMNEDQATGYSHEQLIDMFIFIIIL